MTSFKKEDCILLHVSYFTHLFTIISYGLLWYLLLPIRTTIVIEWLQSLWPFIFHPTLACEFQGFRVGGKFVFWTLELTDTPTNLANQAKVGHALDQSRSVQSRGPERAHQNNEPSWRSSRTDSRLSRQFWDD